MHALTLIPCCRIIEIDPPVTTRKLDFRRTSIPFLNLRKILIAAACFFQSEELCRGMHLLPARWKLRDDDTRRNYLSEANDLSTKNQNSI